MCTYELHYTLQDRNKKARMFIYSQYNSVKIISFSLSQVGYVLTSDDVPWCRENLPQILETENNSIALFAEDHYDRCEKLFKYNFGVFFIFFNLVFNAKL